MKRWMKIATFGVLAIFLLYFVAAYLLYGVSQKTAVSIAFNIRNMEGVEVVKYKYKYKEINECYAAELSVSDKDFESFLKSVRENEVSGEPFPEEVELVKKEAADLRWYNLDNAVEIYKYLYEPEYGYIYPFYNIRQYSIFSPPTHEVCAVMYASESRNGQRRIYLEAFK